MENLLRTTDETAGPGGKLKQAAIMFHASGMDIHRKNPRAWAKRTARFVRRRGRQVGAQAGGMYWQNVMCFSCNTRCAGLSNGLK